MDFAVLGVGATMLAPLEVVFWYRAKNLFHAYRYIPICMSLFIISSSGIPMCGGIHVHVCVCVCV